MNNSIEQIREALEKAESVIIAAHTNPDGDAIGSVLAFSNALNNMGKKVYALLEDYAEKYSCVPGKEFVYTGNYEDLTADVFLSLDCGDTMRLKNAEGFVNKIYTINVDHHVTNEYFGNLNYVDPDASSTSEIVYRILDGWYNMEKNTAICIYVGIVNDTGGFRFTNTSPATMSVVSELMTYNFNFSDVYNRIYHSRTFKEVKIMGEALQNTELLCDGKFVISHVSMDTIKKYGGTIRDVQGVSEYLKGITGTEVSILLYEKGDNEVKGSLRSEDSFDVAELSQKFGGGGHKKSAGCTFKTSLEEAVSIMKNEVISRFEKGE